MFAALCAQSLQRQQAAIKPTMSFVGQVGQGRRGSGNVSAAVTALAAAATVAADKARRRRQQEASDETLRLCAALSQLNDVASDVGSGVRRAAVDDLISALWELADRADVEVLCFREVPLGVAVPAFAVAAAAGDYDGNVRLGGDDGLEPEPEAPAAAAVAQEHSTSGGVAAAAAEEPASGLGAAAAAKERANGLGAAAVAEERATGAAAAAVPGSVRVNMGPLSGPWQRPSQRGSGWAQWVMDDDPKGVQGPCVWHAPSCRPR